MSALRAGIQFANASAPKPVFSEPSWGFVYNSVPFGMRFEQMMGFLYGARYAHHPSWHQPFLISWIHIDKAVWNTLNPAQQAAIARAAKESVLESYNATESVECAKLKAILDINKGIHQRNIDGTIRTHNGKPSAPP